METNGDRDLSACSARRPAACGIYVLYCTAVSCRTNMRIPHWTIQLVQYWATQQIGSPTYFP